MTQNLKPVIFGISGTVLTDAEKIFLRDINPLGIILFKRNVESLAQVKSLTQSLREAAQNPKLWIAIDQEGGRVARIQPPLWPAYPAANQFGELYAQNPSQGLQAAYDNYTAISVGLRDLGINMNCVPLLDIPVAGAHDVIGNRAFSQNADAIVALGKQVAQATLDAKVFPVIKHIPGHGRSMVDSHDELPHVDTDLKTLQNTDFKTFRQLAYLPFAMTAHIVYTAIDPDHPATLSKTVIDRVIRGDIGFHGLLMSDDLGMKALRGNFADLARQTLEAGCDIVLHCSGKMDEMQKVAQGLPKSASDRVLKLCEKLNTDFLGTKAVA